MLTAPTSLTRRGRGSPSRDGVAAHEGRPAQALEPRAAGVHVSTAAPARHDRADLRAERDVRNRRRRGARRGRPAARPPDRRAVAGQERAPPARPAGGSRVYTVYVPLRHGEAKEDLLRVILPPRGKGRPLAAA